MVRTTLALVVAAVAPLLAVPRHSQSQEQLSCVALPATRSLADLEVPLSDAFGRTLTNSYRPVPVHAFWAMSADPSQRFGVVLGWTEKLGDIYVLGAYDRDSLCYAGGVGMGGGAHVSDSSASRWNRALERLGSHLLVTTAAQAQRLAAVALAFSTGVAFDSVVGGHASRSRALPSMELYTLAYLDSTTVHWVSPGWSVGGSLQLSGRRLFFVRVQRDGHLMQVFMQDPPDPGREQ